MVYFSRAQTENEFQLTWKMDSLTHPLLGRLGVHANEKIHIAHSPGTDKELLIEHQSERYNIAYDIKLQHMAHMKRT